MLLTSFSFSNQFCRVFEHCGPVVPLSQRFPYQGPRFDVVAAYALVYLPEYVAGVFLPYLLKNGCREASFIKGPLMNSEFADLAMSLDASFGSLGNVPSTK